MDANAKIVGRFHHAVVACNLNQVPETVRAVIESEAWRARQVHVRNFKFDNFRDFITASPVKGGMGWELELVKGLLQKSGDVDALVMWEDAIKVGQGKRTDLVDNINEVKPSKGTSRAYTLTRLKHERSDLFERVKRKELSANAAAIEAGWRKKPVRRCPQCGHEW